MFTATTTQTDIEILSKLNHDYVVSVQNGDLKRFGEILAEDFKRLNPDLSHRQDEVL